MSINYINARVATVQAVNIIDRQDNVVVVNRGRGGGRNFSKSYVKHRQIDKELKA